MYGVRDTAFCRECMHLKTESMKSNLIKLNKNLNLKHKNFTEIF